MTTTAWDPDGRVPAALGAVVADFGPAGLSDPQALGNLLADLLPDAPRATNLLVAAAENDVAGSLSRLCATLSPDEAVAVVARSLGESRSIEAAASQWVTVQVARSLGYEVSLQPPPASPPVTPPTTAAPPPQPWGAVGPPIPWSAQEPGPTWDRAGASAPPPQPVQQPTWSPPAAERTPAPVAPPTPKGSPALRIVLAVASVIAVALVYVIVAAVAKLPPLSSSSSTTVASPTTAAAPATTTNPADAQLTLDELMPFTTMLDPTGYNVIADCTQFTAGSGIRGLTKDLNCINIPGYAGWQLDGYKFDSAADYLASFTSFNSGFDASTAADTCPPLSGSTTGKTTWTDNPYPGRPDQYVECFMAAYPSNGSTSATSVAPQQVPVFLWNLPSQHAFFEMIVPPGVTFAQLNVWWEQHGDSGFPGDGHN